MHHWTVVTCLCLLLVANDAQSTSSLRGSEGRERHLAPLKTYIVVYKETTSSDTMMKTANTPPSSMINSVGGQVISKYRTVLNGAVVTLTDSAAEQLKNDATVDFIVEDTPVSISTYTWGLDRIDQSDLPLDGNYRWKNNMDAGAGVNVCVGHSFVFLLIANWMQNKKNLT